VHTIHSRDRRYFEQVQCIACLVLPWHSCMGCLVHMQSPIFMLWSTYLPRKRVQRSLQVKLSNKPFRSRPDSVVVEEILLRGSSKNDVAGGPSPTVCDGATPKTPQLRDSDGEGRRWMPEQWLLSRHTWEAAPRMGRTHQKHRPRWYIRAM
jgi:hypothetical protein